MNEPASHPRTEAVRSASEDHDFSRVYLGRLAPSPTGLLHLGHAATFLTAHDRARGANGRLLLRIDDLDPQRSKQLYADAAKEDLLWLGLTWDTEFRQSHRLDRYHEALQQLLTQAQIYPCTCSRKDLQQALRAPHDDDEPLYNGHCRPVSILQPGQVQPATNYRFRVPHGKTIAFNDLQYGPQRFTAGVDLGDFLVWRKDDLPSYQLACVIDDADTGITEVVRGRDLLKSTARQILLQRALNFPTPKYFHTDLLRDNHGERLAKRHDALSLRSLRAAGVTPQQIRTRVQALLHHTEP